MGNKFALITFSAITILGIMVVNAVGGKEVVSEEILGEVEPKERITLAVCPTWQYLVQDLDSDIYEIYPTGSTSESMILLSENIVDYIISGRVLFPTEPELDYVILSENETYSLLGFQEEPIFWGNEINELRSFTIYTDQDIGRIMELFEITEVQEVEDVYEHVNKGIAITSWENTDYSRAFPVHLLLESGERVPFSRRATLYCKESCNSDEVLFLIEYIKSKI